MGTDNYSDLPSVLHMRLPSYKQVLIGYVAVNNKTGEAIRTGSTPYGKRPRVYKTRGTAKAAMNNSTPSNIKLMRDGMIDIIPVSYSLQIE